jgi:hypothetical protein
MAFNDLQRVGLPWHEELAAREACPEGVGLLAVSSLVPGGPGDLAGLKPGGCFFRFFVGFLPFIDLRGGSRQGWRHACWQARHGLAFVL